MTAARTGWTRRRVLTLGLASAGAVAAGVVGAERGILPGKAVLDTLDGACSVPGPAVAFAPLGPSSSGTFYEGRPGTGRSATRSRTRPGTGPGTNCRWWSCSTATAATTPTR